MDSIEELSKVLVELKAERALVEDTILTLQRLVVKRGLTSPVMKQALIGGRPKGSKRKLKTISKPNGRA